MSLHAREAGAALSLAHARVNRNGAVPAAQKLAEQQPAEVVGVPRDAGDGEALRGQKGADLIQGCHN